MTQDNEASEALDKLEEILVLSILPAVREIKKVGEYGPNCFGQELDEKTIARNLIGKIGMRIAFGKSKTIDNILVGRKMEEK